MEPITLIVEFAIKPGRADAFEQVSPRARGAVAQANQTPSAMTGGSPMTGRAASTSKSFAICMRPREHMANVDALSAELVTNADVVRSRCWATLTEEGTCGHRCRRVGPFPDARRQSWVTQPLLIGIDVGTSSCKSTVVTVSGRVIAEAGQRYPTRRTAAGEVSQDPADWLRAVGRTLKACLADVDAAAVEAIGITAPAHYAVLLDRERRPVGRVLLSSDGRPARPPPDSGSPSARASSRPPTWRSRLHGPCRSFAGYSMRTPRSAGSGDPGAHLQGLGPRRAYRRGCHRSE